MKLTKVRNFSLHADFRYMQVLSQGSQEESRSEAKMLDISEGELTLQEFISQ